MQASAPADEIDVISEADLFLNYGRDAQAEDLLKEALQKKPGNIPIQLKLLSIYAVRKDVNKFTTIARQIKDTGDLAAWEQTATLGRTVDPGNPMYGEASAAAPATVPDILSEPGKQGVKPLDMDVGFNIPMDLDVTSSAQAASSGTGSMDFDVSSYTAVPAMDMDVTGAHHPEALLPDFDVTGGHMPSTAPAMDFDVTGSHPNVVGETSMDFDVTGSHPNVIGATGMDFDVTGSHPNVLEASGMDFDVTGSHPSVGAELPGANMSTVVLDTPMEIGASPASTFEALGGGMDFDFSSSSTSSILGSGTETSGSGMDFDLSASSSATAPGTGTDTSGLDTSGLGMDFDLSASSTEAAPAAAVPAMEPFSGLGGLDFDITGSHAPVAPEEPGENLSTVILSAPMDLDISTPSFATPETTEASTELGGLDFDISGSQPMPPTRAPGDTTSTVILSSPMDFDISAPSPAVRPAAEAPAPGMGGMDFDLSASSSMVIPASGGALADLGGMDFDISATQGTKTESPMDLSGISLDVGAGEGSAVTDTVVFPASETKKDEGWQEVENKLDLAKAFLTGMGDVDTARELLGEVLNEGDAQQVETARSLIQQI